ncbi:MAG: hypothetical protein F2602_05205 [Actinobacteria bacterium]|uniref:Unannotated protein n=1 Tax=freshwater metagenome TaxID=449393 RepID=A0A6J6IXS2_9ZZZZ|nr:hypothetical protein [Actinomycetota bacterium]
MSRPGLRRFFGETPLWKALSSSRGSISVLTLGLFGIVLLTALILTNISAIYIAKRTLSLATEAAVQQGVKNLDMQAYYTGENNLSRAALTLLGLGESDPGIPIDCSAGSRDAEMVINSWSHRDSDSYSSNLSSIQISTITCDGFQMEISTVASVAIPIPIPFINLEEIRIQSRASAIPERADSNNYMGLDIG